MSVNVAIVRHRQQSPVAKFGLPTSLFYSFHSMRIGETQPIQKMIPEFGSLGIDPEMNANTL